MVPCGPYAPGARRGFFCTFLTGTSVHGLLLLAAAVLLTVGLAACGNDDGQTVATVRFAVIADPHIYDAGLGTEGPAFEAHVRQEVKMLAQSKSVFEAAVRLLLEAEPPVEFLLIPGDLTNQGEEDSHLKMAALLQGITDAGIGVFVIPGNHDVANPEARAYGSFGSAPVSVYSPDAAGFETIYAPFGYAQALSRDPHSLSYIAEPAPGLRLFAIDACRYEENTDIHVVGGRIKPETMDWLMVNLERARLDGKRVVAMMHHGIVEHLLGQATVLPDYLIENWETGGYALAAAGANVFFTGHYHTQNITRRDWEDDTFLVEIQTGSLLNYPVPLRVVDFDMNASTMDVKSLFVKDLPSGTYPLDFCCFAEFAHEFTHDGVEQQVTDELTRRYDLTDAQMAEIVPMFTDATMAHFAGDERPLWRDLRRALSFVESKNNDLEEIGLALLSLYNDLPPKDNEALIVPLPQKDR